jgi:hypothetical protein
MSSSLSMRVRVLFLSPNCHVLQKKLYNIQNKYQKSSSSLCQQKTIYRTSIRNPPIHYEQTIYHTELPSENYIPNCHILSENYTIYRTSIRNPPVHYANRNASELTSIRNPQVFGLRNYTARTYCIRTEMQL